MRGHEGERGKKERGTTEKVIDALRSCDARVCRLAGRVVVRCIRDAYLHRVCARRHADPSV